MIVKKLPAAFAMALLATGLVYGTATCGRFAIECEAFLNSHNIGGSPIAKGYCSGASGGMAVTGVDVSGEWIEFAFEAPVDGEYTITLSSNSLGGQTTVIKASVLGTDQSTQISFIGLGSG